MLARDNAAISLPDALRPVHLKRLFFPKGRQEVLVGTKEFLSIALTLLIYQHHALAYFLSKQTRFRERGWLENVLDKGWRGWFANVLFATTF